MAKIDEITIGVDVGIRISRKSAETALKLVEMYINQNDSDIGRTYIYKHTNTDGTVSLMLKEAHWQE